MRFENFYKISNSILVCEKRLIKTYHSFNKYILLERVECLPNGPKICHIKKKSLLNDSIAKFCIKEIL